MPERAEPPRLVTIPASDAAFRARVEDLLETEGIATPAELETRLRALLPRVNVRNRALTGEPTTWYVYRDGRWPSSATEAWWTDEHLARITIGFDGKFVAADDAALEILGLSRDEYQAHSFVELSPPGAIEDSQAMFAIVAEGRDLTATVRYQRADGVAGAVDIHASRADDGVLVIMRPATDLGQGSGVM